MFETLIPEPIPGPTPNARISWKRRILLIAGAMAFVAVLVIGVGLVRQHFRPGLVAYRQGEAQERAGHIAQAASDWQRGIREDPKSPDCYVALGDLAFQYQRYGEAAQNYQAAASLRPEDGALILKITLNDLKLGDEAGAYDASKCAVQLLPNDATALAQYGYLEGQKQGYPKAISALRRAVALQPGNSKFLLALIFVEVEAYDMTQAQADLMPYLRTHPQDPKADYEAAAIWSEKAPTPQNVQAGLAYAHLALAGGLANPRLYDMIGQFNLQTGAVSTARQSFEAALRVDPNNDEALHGVLVCDTRLGKTVDAARDAAVLQTVSQRHQQIKVLQIVHRRNPTNIPAALELAKLEDADGFQEAAQGIYLQYAHDFPNDPRTRKALAAFVARHSRPAAPNSVSP
jgi:tetratricopeptide (TPR) repeat protein